MKQMQFTVIDTETGEYPDVEKIALEEEWAKHLIYCDIDSFCIDEDGHLILTDDCGNAAYCPSDRFIVKFDVKNKVKSLEKSNKNWRRKVQRLREKQSDFITRLEVTPLFLMNEQLRRGVIQIAKEYFKGDNDD